jgi:hypothetical protein
MSDTPKFTVIDRRKFKAEEEQEAKQASQKEAGQASVPEAPAEPSVPSAGPQLVVTEPKPAAEPEEAEGLLRPPTRAVSRSWLTMWPPNGSKT